MAVTIAKLSTVSTLDSTKFSAGLNKMRAEVSAFGALTFGAFAQIGSKITGFVTHAIHALPEMVKHSIEAGHALKNMADEIGFSTEGLANLQRVAGLVGVDMGTIEHGIFKLNVTLGKAMNGSKEAADAFAEVGLNFKDLAADNPEQVFLNVLDALKKVESMAQRSAAIRAFFGRGGGPLLRLVEGGSEGLREQMRQTQALGLASRPQDIAKLSEASEALIELQNAVKGVSDQFAIKLAPEIKILAHELEKFIAKTGQGVSAPKVIAQTLPAVLSRAFMSGMGLRVPGGGPPGPDSGWRPTISDFAATANINQGIRERARMTRMKDASDGLRTWNLSGRVFGPPTPQDYGTRKGFLEGEVERIRKNPEFGTSYSRPQEQYLKEMIDELREIKRNTKNLGASQ